MVEVSFNVYSVNKILLYFDIPGHCIHMDSLTLLGAKHPTKQCRKTSFYGTMHSYSTTSSLFNIKN